MHRTGTSALARTLNLLGCDLPHNLMAASEGNEVGHWESNAVVTLNEELLASAGSRWDDWLPINPGWYDSLIYNDFVERGRQVVRDDFAASPLFVLKDPRNCRVAPFWLSVFAAEGITPVIATAIRSPLEVAESLATRDGMDVEYGLLLWLRHVLDAEFATRGYPRTFVAFDQLLDGWQAAATRMQTDLGVTWPRLSLHSSAEIGAFLQREQRHHSINRNAVLADSTMSRWLREVYAILLRWAEHGEDAGDLAQLDAIRMEFDSAGPAFARLVMVGLRGSEGVGAAARKRQELEAELDRAGEQLADIAGQRDRLREQHEARDIRDAEFAAERDRLAQQLTDAQGSAENLLRQIGEVAAGRDSEQARNKSLAGLLDAQHVKSSEAAAALTAEREARQRAEQDGAQLRQAVAGLESRALQNAQAMDRTAQEAAAQLDARQQAEKDGPALRKALASLESRVLQYQQEIIKTAAETAAERQARERADQDRADLRQTVAALESRLLQRQEEISQAWAEAAAERGARDVIQSEIGRLTGHNDVLTSRLVATAEQITALNIALRLAEERGQIAGLAQAEQREHRASAERAGEMLKHAVDAAQAQLRMRTDEIAQLTELVGESESALAAAQTRVAELELRAVELHQQADDLAGQRDATVARNQALAIEAGLAADRAAALAAELDGAAARNGTMEAQIRDAMSAADQLAQQLAAARAETAVTAARLDDRFAEVATLTSQLAELSDSSGNSQWLREVNKVLLERTWWHSLMPAAVRQKQEHQRLRRAGLFDAAAYVARYPDVATSGMDPLRHYIWHGMAEKRSI